MNTNYTYAENLEAFSNIIKKDCGTAISFEEDYIDDTVKLTCKVSREKLDSELRKVNNDNLARKISSIKPFFVIDFPEIKKVIFNGPATIVLWSDGTKTVVKYQEGDANPYSTLTGLALCFSKKALGNNGKYYDTFKKWCSEPNDTYENMTFSEAINGLGDEVINGLVELLPFIKSVI